MIGNQHAIEFKPLKLPKRRPHVDIALVKEDLVIARDLAADISEVNVADALNGMVCSVESILPSLHRLFVGSVSPGRIVGV